MTTDKYAALRAAIGTELTPSPWTASYSIDPNGRTVRDIDVASIGGCGCCGSPLGDKADVDYIAAADPDTIAALLAERDALRAALSAYADAGNWGVDNGGVFRLWREPDSSTPEVYNGFELARAALRLGEPE